MNIEALDLGDDVAAALTQRGCVTNVWPLLIDNGRGAVAVSETGLVVVGPEGEATHPWADLSNVSVERLALLVEPREGSAVRYPLARTQHRAELEAAVERAGGPVRSSAATGGAATAGVGAAAGLSEGRPRAVHRVLPGGVVDAAAAAAKTRRALTAASQPTRLKMAESARTVLLSAFLGGIVAQVAAGAIWAASWPSTELEYGSYLDAPTVTEGGSAVGLIAALIMATFGGFAVMLAIIGWGVMFGMRATRSA